MQDSEVLQVREKAIEKKESSDLATYWRLADRADGYVVGDFQVSRINKGRPAQPHQACALLTPPGPIDPRSRR